jgi:DNA-binding Xre family transcriptional regulator
MITSKVKEIMQKRKFTVRQFVERTGLSSATITNARDERITKCRIQVLAAIADALGVKVKDLFEEV